MLYICIFSNKFDLKQTIRVLHNTQFLDVDINEYLNILKGVGAQIVIWALMTKWSKWKRGGWSKSLCS